MDAHRLFKLSGSSPQERICQAICNDNPHCKTMSGIWGMWCIGCDEPLNGDGEDAIAFKRVIN